MICPCPDYTMNMPYIDGAIMRTGGYAGKWMAYCPWCGEPLKQKVLADVPGMMKVNLNRRHFDNEDV